MFHLPGAYSKGIPDVRIGCIGKSGFVGNHCCCPCEESGSRGYSSWSWWVSCVHPRDDVVHGELGAWYSPARYHGLSSQINNSVTN
jgi:hypothetical protein